MSCTTAAVTRPITAMEIQLPTEFGDMIEEEEEEEEEKGMSSTEIICKGTIIKIRVNCLNGWRFTADFFSNSKIIELPNNILQYSIRFREIHAHFPTLNYQIRWRNRLIKELRVSYPMTLSAFESIRMIFSKGSFFAFSFYTSFAPFISTPNTENTSDSSFAFANWLRK